MIAGHDRFEALAGAIALGEATPSERELFACHAAECGRCRADVCAAASFAELIDGARAAERWRPAVDDGVLRRIRESRRTRARATIGALGWCVALSLAVDVACATGFAGRLGHVFDAPSVASVALVPPRPRALSHRLPERQVAARRQHERAARSRTEGTIAERARAALPAPDAADAANVPDVLAGLDLYGRVRHDSRSVALEAGAPGNRR